MEVNGFKNNSTKKEEKGLKYSISTNRIINNTEQKKTEPEDNIKKSKAIKQGKLNQYQTDQKIKKIKRSLMNDNTNGQIQRITKNKKFVMSKNLIKQNDTAIKRNRSNKILSNPLNISNYSSNEKKNKMIVKEDSGRKTINTNLIEPKTPNIIKKTNSDGMDFNAKKLKSDRYIISMNLYQRVIGSPSDDKNAKDKLNNDNENKDKINEEKIPMDTIRNKNKMNKIGAVMEGKEDNQNNTVILKTDSIKFLNKNMKNENDFIMDDYSYNNNYLYDSNFSNLDNKKEIKSAIIKETKEM